MDVTWLDLPGVCHQTCEAERRKHHGYPPRTCESRHPGTSAVRCGRSVVAGPTTLADHLARVVEAGFTAAELSIDTLHCVLGGRLVERTVDRVAETCASFAPLRYSVHSPAVLDLRDEQYPDIHRAILKSCIRFAGAVHASVLVVHFEVHSERRVVEDGYRAAIAAAADLAGRHEVILGIENIEVEHSERVIEFVERMHHPWVRMTYDFAHDYLAGNYFGYDHRATARAAAPYAAHLHVTDNFGRFNLARLGDFGLYRAIPQANVAIMGLGDLHLPLGWGTLPVGDIYRGFAEHGYTGLLISEHDPRFDMTTDEQVNRDLLALTTP